VVHDLRDGAIAQQAPPDDEPRHVLGGQLAAARRCRAGGRQWSAIGCGSIGRAEVVETRRALTGAQCMNGLPHLYHPHLRGGDHVLPVNQKIQNPVSDALSDRHCS
jgi:hypothetical protein